MGDARRPGHGLVSLVYPHPYARPGNNTFELHATISPHAMADIFVDTVGAYDCM